MTKRQKFVNKSGYRQTYDRKYNKYESIHREIAYLKIYLKHPEKYPLPFFKYEVHHKNRNKLDNRPCNLELVIPEEHEAIHRKDKK